MGMEACSYKPVCLNEEKTYFLRPLLRQMLICSGLSVCYFLLGLMTGAPTVLIPQLRKEANDTMAVSDDMVSWISSIMGLAGLPWVFVLPILMNIIGRKLTFAIVCVALAIGYLIFYLSTTVTHILISEIVLSVALVSNLTVSPATLTEYSSAKYRGVFLTFKSATYFWGIWVSNAIGTFYHWRNICLLALIICCYTITIFFWPESPYWLATKGRFEECAKAHRWLKGTGRYAEEELESIINAHKEYLRDSKRKRVPFSWELVLKIYKCIKSPEFYAPLLLGMLLFLLFFSSAKLVCVLYAIDIIKKMTTSEQTAYKIMLILDGVTVFCMYLGCVISKYFNRKTILLTSSSIGIFFLLTMSLYLYLISFGVLVENNYVSILLLVLYNSSISVGPLILCTSLQSEIVPMRYKSTLLTLISMFSSTMVTVYLKLAPTLFRLAGIHGAFLFYGLCSIALLCLLYKYLPETKNKTLQELEDRFRSNSRQVTNGRGFINVETNK